MAQKITPAGYKLLVLPLETKKHITQGNIVLVEGQLMQGKVLEVGLDAKDIYSVNDIVIFPKNTGVTQYYNGQSCIWLNGTAAPNGDIFGIEKEVE